MRCRGGVVEEALSHAPYTFGDQFTVLDIYVWMLAQWMTADGWSVNARASRGSPTR
jgi:glutathione S-transferase